MNLDADAATIRDGAMEAISPHIIFTADQVEAALARMTRRLADRLKGRKFTLIPILDGGVFVFTRMAPMLYEAGVEFDYRMVRVRRTAAPGEFREPVIDEGFLKRIQELKGKSIVYLDDICDQGETFVALTKASAAVDVESVTCVALVNRKAAKSGQADIIGLETDSTHWLYGSGMDLNGAHRELRSVLAIRAPKLPKSSGTEACVGNLKASLTEP
jgi:hypoxanthine-guanine phosphoribosyltransferase